PVLSVEFLSRFGKTVFQGKSAKLERKPPRAGKLEMRKASWPVAGSQLLFTIGKGGVGKTTTTAGLAFRGRATQKNVPVNVCSTDPAPSLDDVFQQEIGNRRSAVLGDPRLGAIEVDSIAEFRRWAGEIRNKLDSDLSMEAGGLHVDLSFEKQVFAALMEVVPPGVDEVFAIFRIMELLKESQARAPGRQQQSRVLIDMAPTGHALELLRMPERMLLWSRLLLKSLAAHRTLALAQDVAVELASLGQRVRSLIALMKDPQQSRVVAVMLPEPAPDRQTMRLLRAVADIGSTVDSIFVNRVLVEDVDDCKHCLRRRGWQIASLHGFRKKYPGHTAYLIKEFSGEIAGAAGLRKLTKQLWQIAE
ncbi:MAG: ArsA family ATPase, partial [Candidatus Angelobacter sp.]